MSHYYKDALLVGYILVPFLIMCLRNRFLSTPQTAVRFLVAVLAVWAYTIGVRLIVVPLDLSLATTPEQIQRIYDGDGAKNAFAAVFGWVPGVLLATIAWVWGRVWRIFIVRMAGPKPPAAARPL
jgi:hypothetical protein